MEVVCDGVPCRVEVRGYVISCTPLGGDGAAPASVFSRSEINQLLRSRRDQASAKVVVGSKSITMRFVDPHDRERFIDELQSMESAGGDGGQWVASTICQTAVDLGLLDEAALDALIKEEFPRGVVVAFDAIGSLFDPKTFKLRPITDQLESDIFRQLPVLAKIFERRVTDEETRQRFWEAVVRKYFCFSRTFLEEEIRELEPEETAAPVPAGGEEMGLSSINVMSGRALPKVRSSVLHELGPAEASQAVGPHFHARLFCGQPITSRRVGKSRRCDVHPPHAFKEVSRPPSVSWVMPKESTNRETLELLRRFWRSNVSQKKALRSKLDNVNNNSGSFLQRQCILRAREFIRELGPEEGC
ncbi:hypothetical protein C3747_38g305 [Trypanosoma cruzi]|uniref:TFIIH basal transcription factor subunit n=2 Tax=Trypanosoma cruzi TaxID=5693 RepID=Q4DJC7_TRYCC|nr:hypothetical protein, conserved [Trypanosoma cruzi]EAN92631.1 hypothetical protein, conserved [Trypanosoma cruzi]PWV14154.1 hypothetical protein C3747_38g305 [Trypanosoma cruzi]|eukprot:XP_814482.1 hypothetical protein Tc00.1047053508851.79 [Trypanosoma cruzi strain CL Brener]